MAPSDRHQARLAVYVILRRDGEQLFLRRANTRYTDGKYCVPTGHVDGEEPLTAAAIREAREEACVEIRPEDLTLQHVMHRAASDAAGEYIDFYFEADKWDGEPQNGEPHKCDELRWSKLDDVVDALVPGMDQALRAIDRQEPYSHFGF